MGIILQNEMISRARDLLHQHQLIGHCQHELFICLQSHSSICLLPPTQLPNYWYSTCSLQLWSRFSLCKVIIALLSEKHSFFMFFYQLSSKSFLTIHLLYIFHQMRPQSFPTAGHIHPQEHINASLTMLVYCKSNFLTWVCCNRQIILQGMTHATFWTLTHVPSILKINAIKKT